MEKQEIIEQLYALRAGLSVLSQKTDEVESCLMAKAENLGKLYSETSKKLRKDKLADVLDDLDSYFDMYNKRAKKCSAYYSIILQDLNSNLYEDYDEDYDEDDEEDDDL